MPGTMADCRYSIRSNSIRRPPDLKYLIAERKDVGAETSNRAELAFSGPRHGFASWLAAPGPMGGLDFVSPNAALVGALLMKSGSERYDDIARVAGISDDNFGADLARIESELKIRLKEDL